MTARWVDRGQALGRHFTDGDLRRAMERNADPRGTRVEAVMSRNPCSIPPEALAVEAVELMERRKITQLPSSTRRTARRRAQNIHDLFRAKIL